MQDNQQPESWHAFDNWEKSDQQQTWHLKDQELVTNLSSVSQVQSFNDHLDQATFDSYCHNPSQWQQTSAVKENNFNLKFKTKLTKDELLLRGTPILNARIASSTDHGMLSSQLVDYGTAKRLNVAPTILAKMASS